MLNVGVICRFNLVRSKFLASYLAKNYPSIEFWSAGTNIVKSAAYEFDDFLLKKFGIKIEARECRGLDFQKGFGVRPNLLLVAERSLVKDVTEIYPETEIILLDDIGKLLGLNLRDPIGINRFEFNQEISKYAFTASYAINHFLSKGLMEPAEISAMIPRRESSIFVARQKFLKNFDLEDTTVIHTGHVTTAYLERYDIRSFPIPTRDISSFSDIVSKNLEYRFFHFEHEILNPEFVMPSPTWRRNVEQISDRTRVVLYSAPFLNAKGIFDPFSLFGTLPSLKVAIV